MKVMYWNLRGIGNEPTQNALKKFVQVHNPEVLCLAEPFADLAAIPGSFWRSLNLIHVCTNDRGESRPNIWIFCKLYLHQSIKILSRTDQQISLQVMLDSVVTVFTAVYAKTTMIHRRALWLDLADVISRFVHGPWLVVGDFNAVLGSHEKKGGALVCARSCEEFQAMFDICQLVHIDTKDAQFSWARRRGVRSNVELRLDRCLANLDWLDAWAQFDCFTLPRLSSDHNPLIMSFSKDFSALLQHKLWVLRKALRVWNWEVFGNIHKKVDDDLTALAQIQHDIATSGGYDDLLAKESVLQASLTKLLRIWEMFWREKSRQWWLAEGDKNTSYFHAMCRVQKAQSSITLLREGSQVFKDCASIQNHILDYYTNIFANDEGCHDTGLVSRVIPSLVTEEENNRLIEVPSSDEIWSAIKYMDPDSAPGPDGFNGHFFVSCWDIVGRDVVAAVQYSFRIGKLPSSSTPASSF
ncbi:hypothetical protein ACLB2K_063364 [Fragaria x ananassa]